MEKVLRFSWMRSYGSPASQKDRDVNVGNFRRNPEICGFPRPRANRFHITVTPMASRGDISELVEC